MKLIIVALALVAIAAAAPVSPVSPGEQVLVKILRSAFDQNPDGGYNFGYESEDGSSRQEEGQVKELLDEEKKPHAVVTVRGVFSWVDSDKQTHTIEYIADENGYQATGADIPKNPEQARR